MRTDYLSAATFLRKPAFRSRLRNGLLGSANDILGQLPILAHKRENSWDKEIRKPLEIRPTLTSDTFLTPRSTPL